MVAHGRLAFSASLNIKKAQPIIRPDTTIASNRTKPARIAALAKAAFMVASALLPDETRGPVHQRIEKVPGEAFVHQCHQEQQHQQPSGRCEALDEPRPDLAGSPKCKV